jgi:hypothetical protein
MGRHLLGLGPLRRVGKSKRPSARRVSPARVVQIQPHDTSPEFSPTSARAVSAEQAVMAPLAAVAFVARTSGNNHSNSQDPRRTSHALASPLGGAGSAMLFSVAAAI